MLMALAALAPALLLLLPALRALSRRRARRGEQRAPLRVGRASDDIGAAASAAAINSDAGAAADAAAADAGSLVAATEDGDQDEASSAAAAAVPVPAPAAASKALRLGPVAAAAILLGLTVMPSASIQSGSLRYKLFSEADQLCYTQAIALLSYSALQ